MFKIAALIFTISIITLNGISQDTTTQNWRLFPSVDQNKEIKSINGVKQLNYANMDGNVKVFQDARIDKLGEQLREKPYIYGYTLQLEVSQQKNIIKDARYKIMKISPDIELDDPYESPNIYLYAGRFYDRASAYQYKKEISSHFPNAIVVGPKKMEMPVIKTPEIILPIQDSSNVEIEDPRNN